MSVYLGNLSLVYMWVLGYKEWRSIFGHTTHTAPTGTAFLTEDFQAHNGTQRVKIR